MSLKAFHAVFIAASLLALGFTAWWASGRNAAAQKSPGVLAVSLLGIAALAPYLVWKLRRG